MTAPGDPFRLGAIPRPDGSGTNFAIASNSWEYYYQQANNDDNNPELQGFSISHEPSPWMGDRNQLQCHLPT